MADTTTRMELLERLRRLTPSTPRRWGRMTAPQMVAHLTDQMRHTLGDVPCRPVRSIVRWPIIRTLALYWVPWPKGRIQGPPDAFVTQPVDWDSDIATLVALVERFGERKSAGGWPNHALFGTMGEEDWGFFCHKHFDHHLRQFGL
ncbi:MAG: DUF1569 domain-containing protein [Candidatus Hydrogenedentes bacterium]|nr:DUF1569 domain-containing protein [Candidatus Hydrogenedentota bacterium]